MKNKKRLSWIAFAVISISLIVIFVNGTGLFRKNSNSANSPTQPESLSIHRFQPIQGTSIFIATVEQKRDWSSNFGASRWFSFEYGYTVRNLVFLDGNTLLSHYLFDTNSNYIVDTSQFPSPTSYPDTQPIEVKWLVYKIAQQDTNSDGAVNSGDSFSIALSDAKGHNYIELIKSVNAVYGMDLLESNLLLLVYNTNGVYLASKIDLEQQIIVETKKMALIPSK